MQFIQKRLEFSMFLAASYAKDIRKNFLGPTDNETLEIRIKIHVQANVQIL